MFACISASNIIAVLCSAASVVSDSLRPHVLCRPQAPLSTGFSRQEYWSALPCLPPGDLPVPGIELESPEFPAPQADSLPLSHRRSY